MFNKFQKAALAAYGGGQFAHVSTMEEVQQCGDTLFHFIMIELGDDEDCFTLVDALRRMETAASDIQTCLGSLEAMVEEEVANV